MNACLCFVDLMVREARADRLFASVLVGWLSKVLRPTRHSLGHFGDDDFTGQMTQPTVSKH